MINHVHLLGNLGDVPTIRTLSDGAKVATMRVATTEKWHDAEGKPVSRTQWHTVTAWRALAEIAEKYGAKGAPVTVLGKLEHRSWEDKEGVKHYASEVVAHNLYFFNLRPSDGK